MRDLPALWRSPQWRAEIEAWLLPALADAGRTVTGPLVQERVRFWSTVLHVETDAGRVWVKANAPSQAFEAALVEVVEGVVPGLCAPLVAVDTERGWFATADLGMPLSHDADSSPTDDWVAVVEGYAAAQTVLAEHADAVLAAGVPPFPEAPDDVVGWVTDRVDALRALPAQDPRRPTEQESALVDDGLGRIHDAAAVLAASGMPSSLQHNDLHLANAFRRPEGGMTYIDLGDAVWSHPLTTLRVPLWIMRERLGLAEDDPALRRGPRRGAGAVVRPLGPRHPDRAAPRRRPAVVPAPGRVVGPAPGRRAGAGRRRTVRARGDRVGRRRRGARPVRLRRCPLTPLQRPAGWALGPPRCRTQWEGGGTAGDFPLSTRTS